MSLQYCPNCGQCWQPEIISGYPTCSCGWQLYDNPTPVVAALVFLGEQTVLVRNHEWPTGMYGLVTGYLEKNEDPEAAVVREVQEELNLTASATQFIGHHTFTAKNQLLIGYAVTVASGDIQLNEELAEYKLIDTAKLKAWPFGTGDIVRQWLVRG